MHNLNKGLHKYIANYDNILHLGDLNLKFSEPCLNDFRDIYNLKTLVKEPTCYENPHNPSCTDLFLTNRSTRTVSLLGESFAKNILLWIITTKLLVTLTEFIDKHFSKLVENFDIDETLANNKEGSNITDPVFNLIRM